MAKQPSTVVELSSKKLMYHLRQIEQHESAMDSANGSLREAWKEAKESGVHIDAMKLARKLRRKDAAQQNAWLRAFDDYCDVLNVGKQEELPLEGDTDYGPVPTTPPAPAE